MAANEQDTTEQPQYILYKASQLDEAGIRTFAGIYAAFFMRAHGIKIPPQMIRERTEAEQRFGEGPVPDLGGLPECLSDDEVAQFRLTDEERKLIEAWSTLWDDQDDTTRWMSIPPLAGHLD